MRPSGCQAPLSLAPGKQASASRSENYQAQGMWTGSPAALHAFGRGPLASVGVRTTPRSDSVGPSSALRGTAGFYADRRVQISKRVRTRAIASVAKHSRGAGDRRDRGVAVALVSSGEVATIALEECNRRAAGPGPQNRAVRLARIEQAPAPPSAEEQGSQERTLTPMGAGGGVGCATGRIGGSAPRSATHLLCHRRRLLGTADVTVAFVRTRSSFSGTGVVSLGDVEVPAFFVDVLQASTRLLHRDQRLRTS